MATIAWGIYRAKSLDAFMQKVDSDGHGVWAVRALDSQVFVDQLERGRRVQPQGQDVNRLQLPSFSVVVVSKVRKSHPLPILVATVRTQTVLVAVTLEWAILEEQWRRTGSRTQDVLEALLDDVTLIASEVFNLTTNLGQTIAICRRRPLQAHLHEVLDAKRRILGVAEVEVAPVEGESSAARHAGHDR